LGKNSILEFNNKDINNHLSFPRSLSSTRSGSGNLQVKPFQIKPFLSSRTWSWIQGNYYISNSQPLFQKNYGDWKLILFLH